MNIHTYFDSPLGTVAIQASDDGLTGLWFESQSTVPTHLGQRADDHPILLKTVSELQEYFLGKRRAFSVPVAPNGTQFQRQVWQALRDIPYGKSCSYQDLAIAIGNKKAVRAVGTANSKNPISIIVPCHRVIGKNGTLTGYAGGVERKAWLLQHEAKCNVE